MKNQLNTLKSIALTSIVLFLIISGCATTPPQPAVWSPEDLTGLTPASTQSSEAPAEATLPAPKLQDETLPPPTELPLAEGVPGINPLTGLTVADPTRLDRRPVMVKVSNYPRAGRPHAGLTLADIVFEYYIGFGFNRFMALFLGQDSDLVGPVRSGRLVDAQLAEMYQGILFYGNADSRVDETLIKELGPRALAEKYLPSPPKYRIEGTPLEITLFANSRELTNYYTQLNPNSKYKQDLRGMIFSEEIHPVNEPATFLGVQFSRQARGEWHYNKGTALYERWIEADPPDSGPIPMIPLIDRVNNRQISAANVILVFATYTEFAPTLHDIALFDQNAGKRAVVFRDGVRIEGTWKLSGNGRPIQFFNNWGLPLTLKPGNSWIVFVGDTSKIQSAAPGQWELRFDIP
jgi:hypothetical protein